MLSSGFLERHASLSRVPRSPVASRRVFSEASRWLIVGAPSHRPGFGSVSDRVIATGLLGTVLASVFLFLLARLRFSRRTKGGRRRGMPQAASQRRQRRWRFEGAPTLPFQARLQSATFLAAPSRAIPTSPEGGLSAALIPRSRQGGTRVARSWTCADGPGSACARPAGKPRNQAKTRPRARSPAPASTGRVPGFLSCFASGALRSALTSARRPAGSSSRRDAGRRPHRWPTASCACAAPGPTPPTSRPHAR